MGTTTAEPIPVGKKLDLTSLGFQLTETGINEMPSISGDEKQIVFVSRQRPAHSQSQIYIYDLYNLTERRVTFQDGDCRDPLLLKNSPRLIYSSNTDELKENPLLFEPKAEPKEVSSAKAMEMYLSDLSGADIIRLTDRKGFDASTWQRPDRPSSFIYSSEHKGAMEAWQINIEQKVQVPLLQKKNISIFSLRPNPKVNRWAWIERSSEETAEVLTSVGKNPGSKEEKLNLPVGDYRDLLWLDDDHILFSAKINITDKPSQYYQLYSYHVANKCLGKVFESAANLRWPQLLKNQNSLIFSSDLSGKYQIYNKALSLSEQCLTF